MLSQGEADDAPVAQTIDLAASRPLEAPSTQRAKLAAIGTEFFMATAALFFTFGAIAGAVGGLSFRPASEVTPRCPPVQFPVYTVEMTVRLPLPRDAFDAGRQARFKEAVAASAGTSESSVTIVTLSDVAGADSSLLSLQVLEGP